MKRLSLLLALLFLASWLWASGVSAYTITDSPGDAIGSATFESFGIDVYNFTPGTYSGNIGFSLYTNFPQGGFTVNGSPPWYSKLADVFFTETKYGKLYPWAVPLVSHDGFKAGFMYAVGSYKTSDDFDPSGGSGGYIYNHNIPVSIATLGNNYGITTFPGGIVFNSAGGNPAWSVDVTLGVYEDAPDGKLAFVWGTADCANDVVSGTVPTSVPEPNLLSLLGMGLVGLALFGRKKK